MPNRVSETRFESFCAVGRRNNRMEFLVFSRLPNRISSIRFFFFSISAKKTRRDNNNNISRVLSAAKQNSTELNPNTTTSHSPKEIPQQNAKTKQNQFLSFSRYPNRVLTAPIRRFRVPFSWAPWRRWWRFWAWQRSLGHGEAWRVS